MRTKEEIEKQLKFSKNWRDTNSFSDAYYNGQNDAVVETLEWVLGKGDKVL